MPDQVTAAVLQALAELPADAPASDVAAGIVARLRGRGLVLEQAHVMVCSACGSQLCFAGELLCETARAAGVSVAQAVPASQVVNAAEQAES